MSVRTPRLAHGALAAAVLALTFTAAAAAHHLDPRRDIRPGDARRAAAMLALRSDLPSGFRAEVTSDLDPHLTCRALDESDLVVTGEATSPYWARDYRLVGSSSFVYRTSADSNAAWRRRTSRAARVCTREAFESQFERQGETVRVTVQPLPFASPGVERQALRIQGFGAATGRSPILTLDVVQLRHGRAQAALLFAGVVVRPDRALETALARVVARRMRASMRGA